MNDREKFDYARKRLAFSVGANSINYTNIKNSFELVSGNQWDANTLALRGADNRISLTDNRLPSIIHQVTNEVRKTERSIIVNALHNDDKKYADIIGGIIRHYEDKSQARTAYDTVTEQSTICGLGYLKVEIDYISENSFDLECRIKVIENPLHVVFDANSKCPVGSDAQYAFHTYRMEKKLFELLYPDAEFKDSELTFSEGLVKYNDSELYYTLTDYYHVENEVMYVVQDGNGQLTVVDQLLFDKMTEQGDAVVNSRRTLIKTVKQCSYSGGSVFKETTWHTNGLMPIIPVYGDRQPSDNGFVVSGMAMLLRDQQALHNLIMSSKAEAITVAPLSPIMASKDAIEGHEEVYATANTKFHSVITYNQKITATGEPIPPPQRLDNSPNVTSYIQLGQETANGMREASSVFLTAQGGEGNEISGTAIQRRVQQTNTSHYHISDNLGRSMVQLGRVLTALIPVVNNVGTIQRIIDNKGNESYITINEIMQEKFESGNYHISIDTGKNQNTLRQEAVEAMMQLAQIHPPAAPVIADLIAVNSDWPLSDEIAERLKLIAPAEIQALIAKQSIADGDNATDKEKQLATQVISLAEQLKQLKQQAETAPEHMRLQLDTITAQGKQRVDELNAQGKHINALLDHDIQNKKLAFEERKLGMDMVVLASQLATSEVTANANAAKILNEAQMILRQGEMLSESVNNQAETQNQVDVKIADLNTEAEGYNYDTPSPLVPDQILQPQQ